MSTTTLTPGFKSMISAFMPFLVSSVFSSSFTSTLPFGGLHGQHVFGDLYNGAHDMIEASMREHGRGQEHKT